MGTLDIVFLVVIGVAALRASIRGFVSEVMSFAAFILGLIAAILLYRPVSGLLREVITASPWVEIVSFLGVFVVGYLVVKVVERMLHSVLESLHLHQLDRVLGLFLGVMEGLVIVVLALLVLHWQTFVDAQDLLSESWFESVLYPLLPDPLFPDLKDLDIMESLTNV